MEPTKEFSPTKLEFGKAVMCGIAKEFKEYTRKDGSHYVAANMYVEKAKKTLQKMFPSFQFEDEVMVRVFFFGKTGENILKYLTGHALSQAKLLVVGECKATFDGEVKLSFNATAFDVFVENLPSFIDSGNTYIRSCVTKFKENTVTTKAGKQVLVVNGGSWMNKAKEKLEYHFKEEGLLFGEEDRQWLNISFWGYSAENLSKIRGDSDSLWLYLTGNMNATQWEKGVNFNLVANRWFVSQKKETPPVSSPLPAAPADEEEEYIPF